VETDQCLVAHPLIEVLIADGRYPGAGEILLRAGVASGERLVRVERPEAAHAVTVPDGVAVVAPGQPAAVHEVVAGHRFRVSADSFFQPGPVVAEALAAAVLDAAGDALPAGGGGHLVDAYAGVGLFAAVGGAARRARVTAIENHRSAAADARLNLAGLHARVLATDVGRWRARRGDHVDVVVADPSRTGLGKPGVAALAAAGAPRLVLVSCDPASFARDTRLLAGAGYRLATVRLVDAFPHTFHVETVSRFDLDH
ncbi:MAG: class I SAM-dependent RNA methyltransferase, partial [Acidimicrobiales bacterium]